MISRVPRDQSTVLQAGLNVECKTLHSSTHIVTHKPKLAGMVMLRRGQVHACHLPAQLSCVWRGEYAAT